MPGCAIIKAYLAVMKYLTHTRIEDTGSAGSLTYHFTKVIAWEQVNRDFCRVRLDSGGWYTPTTARRINQGAERFNLDLQVRRSAGDFIVVHDGQEQAFDRSIIFYSKRSL